ncbi:DEAD/DEAH box helicase family protein [Streptomyces sp. NPDC042207]|uniref:DEAD/DEAH box helicase family protein n=1 Tax=Streptomyces sp. NPDC042207 TaxID=3154331 RepID=UPI0033F03BAA
MSLRGKKSPRPHQREAINAVFQGFAEHDRGKLIMACGTGKTFTGLKIVERLAAERAASGQGASCPTPAASPRASTSRTWTRFSSSSRATPSSTSCSPSAA